MSDAIAVLDAVAAAAKDAAVKEGGPPAGCGNGILNAGEVCDDGNLLAGDLCSPDCKAIDFGCTIDHGVKGASGGTAVDTEDFVPLCDRWFLAGDRQAQKIVLRSPMTSQVLRSYPLSGTPGRMALDRVGKILWVALAGSSKLAKVALDTNKVSEVQLPHPVRALALRAGGDLFVSLDTGSSQTASVVLVKSGTPVTAELSTTAFPLLAFDASREHLIVAQAGLSPSAIARYLFDPAQSTLTLAGAPVSACANGRAIALSPDAQHLAHVCAGGPYYVVSDRLPYDLATTQGSFMVGAYPEDAAFSPDRAELLATDREQLHRFAVASYTLTKSHLPAQASAGPVIRVGYSTGGKIIFGLRSSATTSWIAWFEVP